MSKLALRTVTPKSAVKAIMAAIRQRQPVMLWGPPGIGKSDLVDQIGKKLSRPVIDVRLALWDPTDLKGMQYIDAETKLMNWAPPVELPYDPNSRAILFLDEFPSANPSVQAAAYQLILNRRIGRYVLPEGVDIVAAGNREGDRGVVYKMGAPLSSRFLHLELAVNFDDWFNWATKNDIHPDVVGYLSCNKSSLFTFDPKSSSRAFACPRTWYFTSKQLHDPIVREDNELLLDVVSGLVGDGVAVQFAAHRKISSKMPLPMDILEGRVKTLEYKELSAMYALALSLCYELKELAKKGVEDWHLYVDRYFGFMMDNFTPDIVVVGAKVALCNYDLDIDHSQLKNFDKFYDKYGSYVFVGDNE